VEHRTAVAFAGKQLASAVPTKKPVRMKKNSPLKILKNKCNCIAYLNETASEKKEYEELQMQKEVAFYSNFISAWIQNRTDQTKQVLALSVAQIGFISTFVQIESIDWRIFVFFFLLF